MFYHPNAQISNNYYGARQANSYIRVFHASPGTPAVDIYANGNLIVKDLAYKEFSQYIPAPSGNYIITAYPSGQTSAPVINTNLYVPENSIFNVAIIGSLPNVGLYPIPEPVTAQNLGRSCLRFIHLSPNAAAVDIKLPDGTKIFNNVGFKDITNYACLPSGAYTFTVNPVGTNNVVLNIPNIRLDPNNYYTIYAVGQTGKFPALETIVVSEPR